MATDYAIRQGLRSKGLADTDVGFDPNTGYVQVKGQNFIKPEMNVEGTTFTSESNFNNAYNDYQKGQKRQQYEQQLINPTPYVDPYKQKKDDLVSQLTQIMNQAQPDPYSTPQYAAYKAQSDRRTNDGIRAAQESLGSSGFGRSTVLGQTAQREQNNANEYLDTQVIPMIMQQSATERNQKLKEQADMFDLYNKLTANDYGMHKDQKSEEQQALEYILSEAAAKEEATNKDREARINYAEKLREEFGAPVYVTNEYGLMDEQVQGMPSIKAQTEQRQLFQEEATTSDKLGYVTPGLAQFIGLPPGTEMLSATKEINNAAHQMGMLGVSQRNASVAERNASTSEGKLAWDKNMDNPSNKPKPEKPPTDFTLDDYNGLIKQQFYGQKDINGEEKPVNTQALRQYIIDLNLTDDQTDLLLRAHRLPTN